MGVAEVTTVIAALAMFGLHFFRGPNRQYDDLAARIERVEQHLAELSKDHNALALRLAGEHYTRAEIKEMHRALNAAVERVQGAIERLLEMQRPRHG